MKEIQIEKFGSKMLVASSWVNKIPYEFLKKAFNCRCTGAWIKPRKWKKILTNSIIWTKNKWGFILQDKLYQVTESKIFLIDEISWVQTEIADLEHDKRVDIVVYNNFAILVSKWEKLAVFNGTDIQFPTTVPAWDTGWIIEYTRWFTFYAINNILYISKPITADEPENSYNFTASESQNITFDTEITWLKGTLNWIYIFTQNKVEFIWANSLQNVAWSATFISTPLGFWWEPVNNLSIAASWDQIFFVTKDKQIKTINYIWWTDKTTIWELSSAPVIGIDSLLWNIDTNQPDAFWFQNQNDETIQFHVRTENYSFNNIVIVYDMINQTWAVDTNKNYNYVVKKWDKYYGFSDINSSIYEDNVWFSDNGSPIAFKIQTQEMNYWTLKQKLFWWMMTAWKIWPQTKLTYRVLVDEKSVFKEDIEWNINILSSLWEIGWESIWWEPIWWELNYTSQLQSFDKTADEWRIYRYWDKVVIEIESISQIQDFLIDILWVRLEVVNHIDINNKF